MILEMMEAIDRQDTRKRVVAKWYLFGFTQAGPHSGFSGSLT
jgi:hypothetical protein